MSLQLSVITNKDFPTQPCWKSFASIHSFCQLSRAGVAPVTFANTYTQKFFNERPRWVSATTAAMEAGAIPFRTVADLKNDHAVFHDFTNATLIELGEAGHPAHAR